MLITTHNPQIRHKVLNGEGFAVEFICLRTGKTFVERYVNFLTEEEINEEYQHASYNF